MTARENRPAMGIATETSYKNKTLYCQMLDSFGTGGMEEVLAAHPDVAECAVIGVSDQLKGQLPMGFVCLNADADRDAADVCKECVKLVREKIGPVAAFKLVTVVDRLPKTRSGKILRGTMVSIADAKPYKMPATIDDPAILDEIKVALGTLGYPAKT